MPPAARARRHTRRDATPPAIMCHASHDRPLPPCPFEATMMAAVAATPPAHCRGCRLHYASRYATIIAQRQRPASPPAIAA